MPLTDPYDDHDTLRTDELAEEMEGSEEVTDTFRCYDCAGASVEYADGSGECLVCRRRYHAIEEPPAGLHYVDDVEPVNVRRVA